eukprot:jgi/Psemu1/39784/gm1.39784_g
MVVPPSKHTLKPDSLNKPAKDSSHKAQAYTPYQNNTIDSLLALEQEAGKGSSLPANATSAKEATIDRIDKTTAPGLDTRDSDVPQQASPRTQQRVDFPSSTRVEYRTGLPGCTSKPTIHMLTYSEYFRATPSPFGSAGERNMAYATIFSYFTLASPPQVLLGHLLNLFKSEAVGTLGIFVADSKGLPCLRLVHGLRKYPGPLAQHSPNKNKAFGYLDDNEGEAGELVLVDAAMLLSPTLATWVLTLDHHLAELEAHPARMSIPVIPEGTAHSELIQAHKAFFIPFDQAMGVLHPQLNRVGLMESCTPLFNTLRLAGTTATEPGGNPKLLQPGPSFRSETGLTNYMKHKRPWDPPGDPKLTAAVTALTDHQLKLSESMDHKKSQSVKTTWGPLYTQRLLLLCGRQEEANLPPIYQAWAQKSKHERTHMIFQSQVAARASELGIQAPLITTAALKRFQDGNFHGTDPFDVADGILPMAFTPPGGSAATLKREQEAAATVAAYDTMISTEGNSLTLKDSLELQKTKAYIPVDWTEATTQLESYLAVLATILGLNHDV